MKIFQSSKNYTFLASFSLLTNAQNTYNLKLSAVTTVVVALLFGAKALFGGLFHSHMILSFFVAFAMPTAGLASTFADRYSGDTEAAVTFTLGSTLFSILTIPALYYLISLLL